MSIEIYLIPLALLQDGRMGGGRVAMKWWAKAMSSLEQPNGILNKVPQ